MPQNRKRVYMIYRCGSKAYFRPNKCRLKLSILISSNFFGPEAKCFRRIVWVSMTAKGKCKRRSATFSFCSWQTMNEWWSFSTFNSRLSFGARIFIVTRTTRVESLRVENAINWLKKCSREVFWMKLSIEIFSTCLVSLPWGMLWMEHHQRQKLSTKTATLPRQHFLDSFVQSAVETMNWLKTIELLIT